MRRENRKPTAREWECITTRRPIVRWIPKAEADARRLERIAGEILDAHLEDEDMHSRTTAASELGEER